MSCHEQSKLSLFCQQCRLVIMWAIPMTGKTAKFTALIRHDQCTVSEPGKGRIVLHVEVIQRQKKSHRRMIHYNYVHAGLIHLLVEVMTWRCYRQTREQYYMYFAVHVDFQRSARKETTLARSPFWTY